MNPDKLEYLRRQLASDRSIVVDHDPSSGPSG